MSENLFSRLILSTDVDVFGGLPPSGLLGLSVGAAMRRMELDGGTIKKLWESLGAVRMLTRLELRQHADIRCGDEVAVSCTHRVIDRATYIFRAEVAVEGKIAAQCDMAFMVVRIDGRKILRISEVEPLFNVPPCDEKLPGPGRIRPAEGCAYVCKSCVPACFSDANGHLAGVHYADIICDASGYWNEREKAFSRLEIAYLSECRAGDEIELFSRMDGGVLNVTGVADGRTAFCARAEYRAVERDRL